MNVFSPLEISYTILSILAFALGIIEITLENILKKRIEYAPEVFPPEPNGSNGFSLPINVYFTGSTTQAVIACGAISLVTSFVCIWKTLNALQMSWANPPIEWVSLKAPGREHSIFDVVQNGRLRDWTFGAGIMTGLSTIATSAMLLYVFIEEKTSSNRARNPVTASNHHFTREAWACSHGGLESDCTLAVRMLVSGKSVFERTC